jgi:hypothetical protein
MDEPPSCSSDKTKSGDRTTWTADEEVALGEEYADESPRSNPRHTPGEPIATSRDLAHLGLVLYSEVRSDAITHPGNLDGPRNE